MKKIALLFCVLNLISVAYSQPDAGPGMAQTDLLENQTRDAVNKINNPTGKIDLSSPESTVRSFAWALNFGDVKLARQCVNNSVPYEKLRDLENFMKPYFQIVVLRVGDFHIYPRNRITTVTLSLSFVGDFGNADAAPIPERLHLQKENDVWLIVPDMNMERPELVLANEDMLAQQAKYMADPDAFTNFRGRVMSQSCKSRINQAGAAMLQFVKDSNGRKFPSRIDFKNQLKLYVVADTIFLCPEDKLQTGYSLNNELSGKPLIGLNARTIMIYEGQNQKIEFRHRYSGHDRTNIVFMDGTTQSFSRETLTAELQSGAVRWKP